MTDAASLLSVDLDQVTATISKETLAAEKAHVESLPDDKLFAEAAAIEAELAKALAALKKKGGAPPAPPAGAASSSEGPIAVFEGAPIDCGKVAEAAITAQLAALSEADLKAMIASTEVELAKAEACLAAKKAAGPAATPSKRPAAAAADADADANGRSPLQKLGESVTQLTDMVDTGLDKAEARTGVPKSTLAATVVAGAVAVGASLIGLFAKKGR